MANTQGQNVMPVVYFDDSGIPVGISAGTGLGIGVSQATAQAAVQAKGNYGNTFPVNSQGPGFHFSQFQSNVPYGIANSGTVTALGAVTLGTALPFIYGAASIAGTVPLYSTVAGNVGGGAWLYYPATAFSTLSAGFYWTVMTSTTVGTVYSAGPGSAVAVGTGSGYTGATSAQVARSISIPANGMGGPNGKARFRLLVSTNNSAGAKTAALTFGGQSVVSQAVTTSVGAVLDGFVANRGVSGAQLVSPNVAAFGSGAQATAMAQINVDTTVATTVNISLTLATATDVVVLEGYEWVVQQQM